MNNRFRKSEDGVTAIEFAMLAPVFLLLLMALFEVSIMQFTNYVLDRAVNQAARTIRTGQAQKGGLNKATFKTQICDKLGGSGSFIKCNQNLFIDVQTWPAFDQITFPDLTVTDTDASGNTTITPNPAVTTNAQYTPGTRLEIVSVSAYYTYHLMTPMIKNFWKNYDGGRILTSQFIFRNEPFPDT